MSLVWSGCVGSCCNRLGGLRLASRIRSVVTIGRARYTCADIRITVKVITCCFAIGRSNSWVGSERIAVFLILLLASPIALASRVPDRFPASALMGSVSSYFQHREIECGPSHDCISCLSDRRSNRTRTSRAVSILIVT